MDARSSYMVKARFVGWVNGKLIHQAPGRPQGTIETMTYHEACVYPWWEPLEHPPELEVPESEDTDSVYERDTTPDLEEVDMMIDPKLAAILAEDVTMKGLEDHIIDVTPPYMPVGRGSMSKEDLVKRIKELGGQANMGIRKADLEERLEELTSSPQ